MINHNDHHEEEEHGDDEIWLISYSDLMTLLFGFFVLMYVFASSKTGESEKVKEGLAKSFGGTYVPPYDELADQLAQQAEEHPVLQNIDIQQPKDGMEITFRSNLLFKSGSAALLPSVKRTMSMIARLISKSIDDAEIFVGGHTDDVPIATYKYPSNWELSGARAASVVREFIDSGYDPKMLVSVGYADTRPAYPNKDPAGVPISENRERNRRVVIKVVAPGIVKQPTGSPVPGSRVTPSGPKEGESTAKPVEPSRASNSTSVEERRVPPSRAGPEAAGDNSQPVQPGAYPRGSSQPVQPGSYPRGSSQPVKPGSYRPTASPVGN